VYNGSTVVNNIMFGPGTDEPIAGVVTGSTPTGWWHADERGSIIARTDTSGNVNLIPTANILLATLLICCFCMLRWGYEMNANVVIIPFMIVWGGGSALLWPAFALRLLRRY